MEIVSFNLWLFHILKNVFKGDKEGIELTYNLGQDFNSERSTFLGIHQFLEYPLYQKEDGPNDGTGLQEKRDSKNERQTSVVELVVPVIFQ